VEVSSRRYGRIVALILVAGLLVGAAALYYESTTVSANGNGAQVSSLQSQVTGLERENEALRSQLASTSSSSGSNATSAESLYSASIVSVVTVQGDRLVTQNTFFGTISTVEIVQGSGFVVDYLNSSYIVTNFHVVDGVTNITVTFSDGNTYPATVKGSDQYSDLAVMTATAPASEFHPLQLLDQLGGVRVGEAVYAIGSPFGLSGSMTFGIVSQTGRTITESTSTQVSISDVIQFSAPINPGNSGGPLLDQSGQVIGITTAAVTNSEGLGFAIPSTTIGRELSDLITTGQYTLHPMLGITGADMTYQVARAAGTNVTYGVLVESVTSGGPAQKAGIEGGNKSVTIEGTNYQLGGDVITSINGSKVVDSQALGSYLEENALAGQTVQLGIIRNGVFMTVDVVLGALS
jgi:S1-C subfamily serine protease